MVEDKIKPKSEHLTAFDVNETQKKLLRFIWIKINREPHYLKGLTEQEELQDLCQGAFMSQGVESKIVPNIDISIKGQSYRIPLAKNIHHFAFEVLMKIKSPTLLMRSQFGLITINSIELWKRFDYYCRCIFGDAIAEAWHRSHEMPKTTYKTAGFGFNPTEKLEDKQWD